MRTIGEATGPRPVPHSADWRRVCGGGAPYLSEQSLDAVLFTAINAADTEVFDLALQQVSANTERDPVDVYAEWLGDAVKYGRPEIVAHILDQGVDPNADAAHHRRWSVIAFAASACYPVDDVDNVAILQLLLDVGGSPAAAHNEHLSFELPNRYLSFARHSMWVWGRDRWESMQPRDEGGDPARLLNADRNDRARLLFDAYVAAYPEARRDAALGLVHSVIRTPGDGDIELILHAFAYVDPPPSEGESYELVTTVLDAPIDEAATRERVSLLGELSVDVNAPGDDGGPRLTQQLAAAADAELDGNDHDAQQHLDIARQLVDLGADISAVDNRGRPAVCHLLVRGAVTEALDFALTQGCDVSIADDAGWRFIVRISAPTVRVSITRLGPTFCRT